MEYWIESKGIDKIMKSIDKLAKGLDPQEPAQWASKIKGYFRYQDTKCLQWPRQRRDS